MVNHLLKEVKDVPWKVKEVMDQRIEFVARAVSKEKTVSELCQAYGISRTTGHHWIKRYREVGSFAGLREKSRRPHQSPGRTPGWVEQRCGAKASGPWVGSAQSCSPCLRPKE